MLSVFPSGEGFFRLFCVFLLYFSMAVFSKMKSVVWGFGLVVSLL